MPLPKQTVTVLGVIVPVQLNGRVGVWELESRFPLATFLMLAGAMSYCGQDLSDDGVWISSLQYAETKVREALAQGGLP